MLAAGAGRTYRLDTRVQVPGRGAPGLTLNSGRHAPGARRTPTTQPGPPPGPVLGLLSGSGWVRVASSAHFGPHPSIAGAGEPPGALQPLPESESRRGARADAQRRAGPSRRFLPILILSDQCQIAPGWEVVMRFPTPPSPDTLATFSGNLPCRVMRLSDDAPLIRPTAA